MEYMLFFLLLFLSLVFLFAILTLQKEVVVMEEVDKGIMEKNFPGENLAHQNLGRYQNLFFYFVV